MDTNLITTELKTFIGAQLTEHKANIEALVASARYDDALVKAAVEAEKKRIDEILGMLNKPSAETPEAVKSIAAQVIDSDQFKAFKSRAKHEGGFVVPFKSFPLFETKTTIDSAALGSATAGILSPQRSPGIKFGGTRRTRISDLIPHLSTTNNAVDFVKENAFTNAAYPQTESSAKAESALTFVIGSAPVRTIAHGIPVSAQALDDFSDLQGAIDYRLMSGLEDEVDFELLRGDGTGLHMTGLFTAATAYNTAYNTSADTDIDQIGAALEQLEDSNFYATGIVMRPAKWRQLNRIKEDISGANTGSYILGGPANMGGMTLWGVPVAVSNAVPVDKFLVGDFATGCAIYDRMEARIDVSNQHSDFFMKNLLMVRAELRMALAIYRPDKFVYGTF